MSTVLMAPLATKGFELPCRVKCQFKGKKGLIVLDQIRVVDKSRLRKNLGMISGKTQFDLCACLQELFACRLLQCCAKKKSNGFCILI
ncbi:MAG: type II toxin-antitoxin system PemK/MazF family toxin [Nitrosomonas nitrosa]|nr:type II toxin-antitoxin system PemK/MazF family toxin [Nitrosomonas nitrosa]